MYNNFVHWTLDTCNIVHNTNLFDVSVGTYVLHFPYMRLNTFILLKNILVIDVFVLHEGPSFLHCCNILLDQSGKIFLDPQDILVSHQIWEEIHVLWYYLIFSGGPIHQVKKMTRIWSLEQLVIQTHPKHIHLELWTNPWNNWNKKALLSFGELQLYIGSYANHLFHCYACF